MGLILRTTLALLAFLFTTSAALAAETRSHMLVEIAADGEVHVVMRWSGLEVDGLTYYSMLDDVGVLDMKVTEGQASTEFSTRRMLKQDDNGYRLDLAEIDNFGDWFDVDLTVRYPGNLDFVVSTPEPSFRSSNARGLMWSIADVRQFSLTANFRNSGEATGTPREEFRGGGLILQSGTSVANNDAGRPVERHPQPSGTDSSLIDEQPELLIDGDPLLIEFRLLINAARREGRGDEAFLQALEKLLTKFYYLLDAMDATDEFKPGE